eukprot:5513537-Prorocentrum_lima.AAC.1
MAQQQHDKLSFCLLFVDIKSAFTHASRLLLFGSSRPSSQWESSLLSSGFSPRSAAFIAHEVMERGCLLAQA